MLEQGELISQKVKSKLIELLKQNGQQDCKDFVNALQGPNSSKSHLAQDMLHYIEPTNNADGKGWDGILNVKIIILNI